MIHAQTRLMVTPQRTAERRLVNPTPMIEPVMVCVVETGMPKCSVKNKVIAYKKNKKLAIIEAKIAVLKVGVNGNDTSPN